MLERCDGLLIPPLLLPLLAVVEGPFRLAAPLRYVDPDSGGEGQGQTEEKHCQERSAEGQRPAFAPLLPALCQAAIGNTVERLMSEVPSQVGRQRGGIGIALIGVGGQTLAEDVRQ